MPVPFQEHTFSFSSYSFSPFPLYFFSVKKHIQIYFSIILSHILYEKGTIFTVLIFQKKKHRILNASFTLTYKNAGDGT